MDAGRRGKKAMPTSTTTSRSSMAAVGKENICPDRIREVVNGSRSPLPEGFPRAPLQDITHILSPSNLCCDESASLDFGHARKRPKCWGAIEAQSASSACEFESRSSLVAWRGIRSCGSAAVGLGCSKAPSNYEEVDKSKVVEKEIVSEHGDGGIEANEIGVERDDLDPPKVEGQDEGQVQELGEVKNSKERADSKQHGKLAMMSDRGHSKMATAQQSNSQRSSLSIRTSSHSAQEKSKMSNLMKLR